MKILVVSDVHGSLRAGNLILDLDKTYNFDKIICLGDFLYNGPRNRVPEDYNPNTLIGLFNSLKDKMIAVRGNCDADVDLYVLDFDIPKMKIVKIKDYTFYLTHGDDLKIFSDSPHEKEIYIKGHTHLPLMYKSNEGGIVLNPGSMTFPKGKLDKSFIIIDDEDIKMYEFNYDKCSDSKVDILNIYSYNNKQYIK